MSWRVLKVATICLWGILLAMGISELANAPISPCYHHTDAAYECSMFINCLTHVVSAQVNKLQHAGPVQQRYIKPQPTTKNITHPQMDTAIRTLRLETSKMGGGPMPLPILVQQNVARENSTLLYPKNWASHLLRGGMLGSQNRKKESRMVVVKRQIFAGGKNPQK